MVEPYVRSILRAFLVYSIATAAGILTGVYLMPAGAFDRCSCQDNHSIIGINSQDTAQYVAHAECEVRMLFRLATRYLGIGAQT